MEFFEIEGYWIDDKSEFSGYIVCSYDGVLEDGERFSDDDIFFYGLSEKEIKENIEAGEKGTSLEFVITGYKKIDA